MATAPIQRSTRARPCPICGGFDQQPRGRGVRCFGYIDSSGAYARCSREDHAGGLEVNSDGTYSHRLEGPCRCGQEHRLPSTARREVAAYSYRDERGELLYEVVRFEPKGFAQRRPDGLGGYEWGLNGSRRVPYRLPDLLASADRLAFIVEGEKDADALAALGLIATTNAGGAGKWRPEFNEALRGRPVAILPDNDEVGRQHAEDVALHLHGVASEVRVVNLPDLPEHGDVSYWLAAGHGVEELKHLVKATASWRPSTSPPRGAIEFVWASEVRTRPVQWFWRGRLAKGKVTAIGGDPGAGKGTIGADVTAHLTTARSWSDGQACPMTKVYLLTGEDAPEDTIVPRLDVAGADLSRVAFLGRVPDEKGGHRRISLDTDADLVVRTVAEGGGEVLIIDPASSYLGADTNSWRDSDMRRVLDPLAEAAARFGVAVILVIHLNKGGAGKAMYRFQGSIASIAAARFAFLVGQHPEDPERRVLACVKSNLAAKPASLAFRITSAYHEGIADEVGRIEWAGTTHVTADDLVGPQERTAAVDRAEEFLAEYLAAGARPSEEVKAAAQERGIGKHAVWEAKGRMGVIARKVGHERWDWSLPRAREPLDDGDLPGEREDVWTQ